MADYFAVDLLRTHHRVAPTKGVAAAKALLAGMDQELPGARLLLDGAPRHRWWRRAWCRPRPSTRPCAGCFATRSASGCSPSPTSTEDVAAACYGTPDGPGTGPARGGGVHWCWSTTTIQLIPLDPAALRPRSRSIGPAADDPRLMEGDYHYPAHLEIIYGSDVDRAVEPEGTGSDLLARCSGGAPSLPGPTCPTSSRRWRGCGRRSSESVEVRHAVGCGVLSCEEDDDEHIAEAVEAATGADVAVVCVGGRSGLTPGATVGEARDSTSARPDRPPARAAAGEWRPRARPRWRWSCSGRVHTLAEIEQARRRDPAWPGCPASRRAPPSPGAARRGGAIGTAAGQPSPTGSARSRYHLRPSRRRRPQPVLGRLHRLPGRAAAPVRVRAEHHRVHLLGPARDRRIHHRDHAGDACGVANTGRACRHRGGAALRPGRGRLGGPARTSAGGLHPGASASPASRARSPSPCTRLAWPSTTRTSGSSANRGPSTWRWADGPAHRRRCTPSTWVARCTSTASATSSPPPPRSPDGPSPRGGLPQPSTATRNSEVPSKGRRSQLDSSSSALRPAVAAWSRNSSKP